LFVVSKRTLGTGRWVTKFNRNVAAWWFIIKGERQESQHAIR